MYEMVFKSQKSGIGVRSTRPQATGGRQRPLSTSWTSTSVTLSVQVQTFLSTLHTPTGPSLTLKPSTSPAPQGISEQCAVTSFLAVIKEACCDQMH